MVNNTTDPTALELDKLWKADRLTAWPTPEQWEQIWQRARTEPNAESAIRAVCPELLKAPPLHPAPPQPYARGTPEDRCLPPIPDSARAMFDVDKRSGRKLKVLGAVLMCVGVVAALYGSAEVSEGRPSSAAAVGAMMLFTGFVFFVIGRFKD